MPSSAFTYCLCGLAHHSRAAQSCFSCGCTRFRSCTPQLCCTALGFTWLHAQVDVYSFGIVLWELWTGREPYEGLNYHALLHQITSSTSMRPPLPGTHDWEAIGEASPTEPAAGFCDLVQVRLACLSLSGSM